MEHRAEGQYDLVDGILVSRASTAGDDDHTHPVSELCALIGRLWFGDKRVQTQYLQSVKVRSARKAARAATERRVIRGSAEYGLSWSSASEGSG